MVDFLPRSCPAIYQVATLRKRRRTSGQKSMATHHQVTACDRPVPNGPRGPCRCVIIKRSGNT